jgi:4-amino-4-deoxy-L-arabinose transferase-like glycosyltransferase
MTTNSASPVTATTEAGDRGGTLFVPAILAMAGAKLLAHVITIAITPYSVHRDELLYLAMGRYLRLFAMDFPPLIALLANAGRFLGGDALWGIRLLPALVGTAIVVLAALIARELGGGRGAQLLAMLAVLAPPLFLRSAALFQPVVFDQLWWTLALYGLVRIGTRGGRPADWLLLGVAGGLGLLTKFSIAFIAAGMAVGLVLTPARRWLATPWPWLAGLLALVIGSPSIIGQIALGFPVAGQMADLQAVQLQRVGPAAFLTGQIMMVGPGMLLAAIGAVWMLRRRDAGVRAAAVACVVAFVLLLVLRGKPYYAGPIYPALMAAGAVGVLQSPRFGRFAAGAVALLVVAYGAVTLPIGLPILPPMAMARYADALGMSGAVTTNTGRVLRLPQDYADMLYWEEQVAAVAAAYHSLPVAERERAVLLGSNYGEAGAIDFFGPKYGLPRAIATVGSYWFFGPGDLPGEVMVTLGVEPHEVQGFYAEFEEVARLENPWGVPEQQDVLIAIARRPAATLQEIWPRFAGQN